MEFKRRSRNMALFLWVGLVAYAGGTRALAQDELDLEATLEKTKSSGRSSRGEGTAGGQGNSAESGARRMAAAKGR
jgi:hypothetical protein